MRPILSGIWKGSCFQLSVKGIQGQKKGIDS